MKKVGSELEAEQIEKKDTKTTGYSIFRHETCEKLRGTKHGKGELMKAVNAEWAAAKKDGRNNAYDERAAKIRVELTKIFEPEVILVERADEEPVIIVDTAEENAASLTATDATNKTNSLTATETDKTDTEQHENAGTTEHVNDATNETNGLTATETVNTNTGHESADSLTVTGTRPKLKKNTQPTRHMDSSTGKTKAKPKQSGPSLTATLKDNNQTELRNPTPFQKCRECGVMTATTVLAQHMAMKHGHKKGCIGGGACSCLRVGDLFGEWSDEDEDADEEEREENTHEENVKRKSVDSDQEEQCDILMAKLNTLYWPAKLISTSEKGVEVEILNTNRTKKCLKKSDIKTFVSDDRVAKGREKGWKVAFEKAKELFNGYRVY